MHNPHSADNRRRHPPLGASRKRKLINSIISGGGARNPLIVAQLSKALPGVEILPSEALGVPGDAKEAFAFALLANETVHGRPANLPSATGAKLPQFSAKSASPRPAKFFHGTANLRIGGY